MVYSVTSRTYWASIHWHPFSLEPFEEARFCNDFEIPLMCTDTRFPLSKCQTMNTKYNATSNYVALHVSFEKGWFKRKGLGKEWSFFYPALHSWEEYTKGRRTQQ
mmetsp:Transcript_37533/g.73523  ORF Transcript_37533/g.73523 Transcript_37533/m.73523 type:complete len:105 (-) Transcript_37533:452-766(-)